MQWIAGKQWGGRGRRNGYPSGWQPGAHQVPCSLSSVVAWMGLFLGCQDGEGLVDLHHGDNEEATGQQEGGPKEEEEEVPGSVEALVQDAGLIFLGRGEAVENPVLVEFGSDLLHISPGPLVVVQAARDVGALEGRSNSTHGVGHSCCLVLRAEGWYGVKQGDGFGAGTI